MLYCYNYFTILKFTHYHLVQHKRYKLEKFPYKVKGNNNECIWNLSQFIKFLSFNPS